MKKLKSAISLVLIGALALTACNKTETTGSEDIQTESSLNSSPESTAASRNGSFDGASGGPHSTSGLTEYGRGYEGIEGTGDYN